MSVIEKPIAHSEVKIGSPRNFGIVFAVAFSVIALLPLFDNADIRIWALVVATTLFLIALKMPRVLQPLNHLWFKFGMILGRVVAPVFLALVFFLVFTPFGFAMRLISKKHILARQGDKSTYWVSRDEEADKLNSFKNQY
jgi:hypothetical protein